MKSILTELPDSKEELVPWLEPILVSSELRHLVSELAVISTHGKPADLNTLTGGKLDASLETGLDAIDEADLQSLFRHPFSLMELQKEILERGGSYWLNKLESSNPTDSTADLREQLKATVQEDVRDRESPTTVVSQSPSAATTHRPNILAIAATVLLAATVGLFAYMNWPSGSTPAVAWGWAAESEDLSQLSESEYLNKLARGADAWFNKRPTSVAAVKQRLGEFKTGCEALLASDHDPLQAASAEWLQQRLGQCLSDVDAQLAKLDEESADAIEIRSAVDQIIRDVALDLREQAKA